MKFTAVTENFSMDYCRFGNGKRVFVIIPGLSIKPVTPLEPVIAGAFAPLADEFTVYLVDRRNNVPEYYSIEEMAEDTVEVLKQLALKDICLYGASQGGMIAQAIAVNHPELVEKLMLGSTASRPNETSSAVIGKWVALAKNKQGEALKTDTINRVYSEAFVKTHSNALVSWIGDISDAEFRKFTSVAAPIATFDIYDRLPEIRCPSLVIGSRGDCVLSGEASIEIAERLGCELYMYRSEYGHAVYDEASDYVGRLLRFVSAMNSQI